MASAAQVQAAAAQLERAEAGPVEQGQIPRTPIATRGMGVNEVTVQFRRWTAHGMTAYQRNQYAGFPLHIAQELVRSGAAVICLPPVVNETAARMVRK
jgi:hypothetical protein